jgi:hypothetical protein
MAYKNIREVTAAQNDLILIAALALAIIFAPSRHCVKTPFAYFAVQRQTVYSRMNGRLATMSKPHECGKISCCGPPLVEAGSSPAIDPCARHVFHPLLTPQSPRVEEFLCLVG